MMNCVDKYVSVLPYEWKLNVSVLGSLFKLIYKRFSVAENL